MVSGNPITAHVLVDTETAPQSPLPTVNLNNLIVDSAGNNINACAPDLIGIYYRNTSGVMTRVVTRNQWVGASESDSLNGCQTGLGIYVQSGNSGGSTVTVQNSSVHDYQKNGITGNETGTTLNVINSDVTGQGSTTGAAENGIQIGFGAKGTVSGNNVIDDIWGPDTSSDPGDAAAGILLYGAAPGLTVKTNTVGNTQFGIALVSDTVDDPLFTDDSETVLGNHVTATRIFDGIDVCSNSNIIKNNNVVNSTESAIHLDASCGSTGNNNYVQSNVLSDGNVGILKDPGTSGNVFSPANTFFTMNTTDPAGSVRSKSPFKPARP